MQTFVFEIQIQIVFVFGATQRNRRCLPVHHVLLLCSPVLYFFYTRNIQKSFTISKRYIQPIKISAVRAVCLERNRKKRRLFGNMEGCSYLEVEDDCPNEAEGELGVAVHNVLPPDVDQLDLLVPGVRSFSEIQKLFVTSLSGCFFEGPIDKPS